ncbi:MAG: rRNA maturation RNase YbeY [Acidithiobacillus sp.]|uniref:rRNA maturation RNase YbeY n=1 Tax=Acidithiobacillus sp. TaxID=1872118 RepID=UPI003CFD6BC4
MTPTLRLSRRVDESLEPGLPPPPGQRSCRAAIVAALTVPSPRLSETGIVGLSLAFVGAQTMAQLNGQFRQRPRPTNCLSFPAPRQSGPYRQDFLGDIVLAPLVVLQEAAEQAKRPRDHYRHLLIHSTLHLLGYDHEDAAEAARMEALETQLLAQMGVADPYQNPDHE